MANYSFKQWLFDHGWEINYYYLTGHPEISRQFNDWDIEYQGMIDGKYIFKCVNKKHYASKRISFDTPFSECPNEIEAQLIKQL